MSCSPKIFGLGLLFLALCVGGGATQDTKKPKSALPPGFKDLGLSAAQKDKIYDLLSDYKTKISALDKQIKELKNKEHQELFRVLTEEQREKYLKAKGFEIKDDKKDTDKKDTDKKDPEKKDKENSDK
jgi:hypothetical protein